jgi:rfaE bifunctional protein nucleotidyltransferase chain/domain
MRSRRTKIVSPKALIRQLRSLRSARRKPRIVFTNGCFDLLHRGHVDYLERARKLGDLLIVALNSDASVQRLKGPERPLNPLEDRQQVMAALECVDFVTFFEADTPLELIEATLPDVLVKGGDWKPSQIVGADKVLAAGGKVRSLKFVEGRSTTGIIARARNQ